MSNMLTNMLLALILLLIAASMGAAFALLLVIRSYIRRFQQFVTSPDEQTPSEFAQLAQTVGKTVGHAAAMQLKTSIMGDASGKARLGEAIASAVVHESQPGLAGLVDAIPRNSRRKNAGIFELLIEKFGPSLLGNLGAGPIGGNGGNGASVPASSSSSGGGFKLGRFGG